MKKGFTLIETLIYIALFTILLGAGFSTAFNLIQSGESLGYKTVTNSELDFVLRKFDWATTGASSFNIISSNELSISRYSSPTTIGFRFNSSSNPKSIEIKEGANWMPLTTVNVEVSDFKFQNISGTPTGIIAYINIDGIPATTTKYIRK